MRRYRLVVLVLILVWLILSYFVPMFVRTPDTLVMIAIPIVFIVPKLRKSLTSSLNPRIAAVLFFTAFLSFAVSSNGQRRIERASAAEAAVAKLAELSSELEDLEKGTTDPVVAFERARAISRTSPRSVGGRLNLQPVAARATIVMKANQQAYVQHRIALASKVEGIDTSAALKHLDAALALDPEREGLKAQRDATHAQLVRENELAAKRAEQVRLKELSTQAKKELAGFRQRLVADRKAAQGYEKAGQFQGAQRVYKELSDTLSRIDKKYEGVASTKTLHREIQAAINKLAPLVANQLKRRAKEEERTATLVRRCGERPQLSGWDGGSHWVESHLMDSAHDPGSIDVENCSSPILDAKHCWVVECSVRGKNAFGAKVLNRMRFSMRKDQHGGYRVSSALSR